MVYQPFDYETYVRSITSASGITRQGSGYHRMMDAFKVGGPRIYNSKATRNRKDDGIRFLKSPRKIKELAHGPYPSQSP